MPTTVFPLAAVPRLMVTFYDCSREDGVSIAYACSVENVDVGHDFVVIAYHHVPVNEHEGPNLYVFAYLGFWMDVC